MSKSIAALILMDDSFQESRLSRFLGKMVETDVN